MQGCTRQCGAILGGVIASTFFIVAKVKHVVVEGEAGSGSFQLSHHDVEIHALLVVFGNQAWKLPS